MFYSQVPLFVQIHHKWRRLYVGECQGPGVRTDFEMVHLRKVPNQYTHLSGLLDVFKSKIVSDLNISITDIRSNYFVTWLLVDSLLSSRDFFFSYKDEAHTVNTNKVFFVSSENWGGIFSSSVIIFLLFLFSLMCLLSPSLPQNKTVLLFKWREEAWGWFLFW